MAGAVDLSGLKQRAAQGAGGEQSAGVEITEVNFESEVLVRSGQMPVVVLLWSPRSDACVQLAETLGALAAEDGGSWSLALINVDTVPRVAEIFGVDAVPTVIALAGGQPLASFQGGQPREQVRRWVDSLLAATGAPGAEQQAEAESVDPDLLTAREKLDAGDFDAAEAAYRRLLERDPQHAEAKGALTQIGFLQRASAQRPDAVAVSDAAPDDIEAAFAAADVQILARDAAGAFARLTALVVRTSGDERTTVRTRLIELFELFDPADPDVIAGRRNLANALY